MPSLIFLLLFLLLQIRSGLQYAPKQATPSVNANPVPSACQTSPVKCAKNAPSEFLLSSGTCSSHLTSDLQHNTPLKADRSDTPTFYSLNLSAPASALDHHIQWVQSLSHWLTLTTFNPSGYYCAIHNDHHWKTTILGLWLHTFSKRHIFDCGFAGVKLMRKKSGIALRHPIRNAGSVTLLRQKVQRTSLRHQITLLLQVRQAHAYENPKLTWNESNSTLTLITLHHVIKNRRKYSNYSSFLFQLLCQFYFYWSYQ